MVYFPLISYTVQEVQGQMELVWQVLRGLACWGAGVQFLWGEGVWEVMMFECS